ncbi:VWA domain-containing protein [Halomonas sp. V046]|uniref:VWA domain-containing protein n=1 Tax=Halomonas sp. V046 TaxID=3459611 RepID=UPI00404436DE
MTAWIETLDAFHLLRPLWCLCLPLIALLWWWRRRTTNEKSDSRHIAPHLERAMRIGASMRRWLAPIDTLALMLVLLVLAAAGPTWSRVPTPLVTQTAPLVVVLEVTPSMDAKDVPPSRLERAKHKIGDLLDRRSGAATALVAYAGSAHQVVPLTDDPGLIGPYLAGLTSDIMPPANDVIGDAAESALDKATALLAKSPTSGAILFVTDGLSPQSDTAFNARDTGPTLAFLTMTPDTGAAPGIANVDDADSVTVTADDADIRRLEGIFAAAYRRALLGDDSLAWEDRGLWLAWPAALLALLWFRRGWRLASPWMMALAVTGLGLGAGVTSGPADAQSTSSRAEPVTRESSPVRSWLANAFLTPDQQGRWWIERRDYGRAAEHFDNVAWRGYALFRDGQYGAAAEMLAGLDDPDAAFTQGLALIRDRQYRPAIDAFERVLKLDPDYPEGERNLALAQDILTHVEDAREQSDTGEDRGEGADGVVFDNESARGEETRQVAEDGDGIVTAEQWMSTLDTSTGDFLRQRFAVEAREDDQ